MPRNPMPRKPDPDVDQFWARHGLAAWPVCLSQDCEMPAVVADPKMDTASWCWSCGVFGPFAVKGAVWLERGKITP